MTHNIKIHTSKPQRKNRYLGYLNKKDFPRKLSLYAGLPLTSSVLKKGQTYHDLIYRFNEGMICAHTGLNGCCPEGHERHPEFKNNSTGRCHNSERFMFGSFDPSQERFIDPCSIERVKTICDKSNIILEDDYKIKKE